RRRASGALVLGIALGTVGVGYAAFAPSSTASEPSADASPSDVAHGEQLYRNACIACHAANLQGVQGRGPSLLGVGQAAVSFQVATGRMPASGQGAQEPRKPTRLEQSGETATEQPPPVGPPYTEEEVNQIAAYVQSVGGGPVVPTGDLRGDRSNLGEG